MNDLSSVGRVFLTGGTGFFGKWLLDEFAKSSTSMFPSAEVVVLSRNSKKFRDDYPLLKDCPNISFREGDIRTFEFPYEPFDYVIHAATEASAKLEQEQPDEMYSVIVDGTERVLEFARRAGVKRLLYVSSGGVYGVQPTELSHLAESSPCNPVTSYGKGKLIAEGLCNQSNVDTVIARCFAFVGEYLPLDTHFAIGNFINNCLRNETIVISGDGTPRRSYMYGSDLVEWLLEILVNGRSSESYNVGSDKALSIRELAHLVRDVAGTENEIVVCQEPVAGCPPARYVPSIEKVRRELGLSVKVELKEAISRTMAWHRKNGAVI